MNLRIGIAGIAIESSTFSPHRSAASPTSTSRRGADLLARYDFLGRSDRASSGCRWCTRGRCPAAPSTAEAYDDLTAEILERLAMRPARSTACFFDIHGAMSVVGRHGRRGRSGRARSATSLGPDVLVSASMDLHGNVSRELVDAVDLITCYRMAPHEDALGAEERAARNLVDAARPRARSARRRRGCRCPVLLPGEKTEHADRAGARASTPASPRSRRAAGVLDAAVWVGYAWADEPRCRAAVVVTGDDERGDHCARRERLARAYWDARDEFAFVAPTGTLRGVRRRRRWRARRGRSSSATPATTRPRAAPATSPGRSARLLARRRASAERRRPRSTPASSDPDAVARVRRRRRRRRRSTCAVGGKVDAGPSGPVALAGEVHALAEATRSAATSRSSRSAACTRSSPAAASRTTSSPTSPTLGLDPRARRPRRRQDRLPRAGAVRPAPRTGCSRSPPAASTRTSSASATTASSAPCSPSTPKCPIRTSPPNCCPRQLNQPAAAPRRPFRWLGCSPCGDGRQRCRRGRRHGRRWGDRCRPRPGGRPVATRSRRRCP